MIGSRFGRYGGATARKRWTEYPFKREGPRPIVYDPTDADELVGATAAAELPVK